MVHVSDDSLIWKRKTCLETPGTHLYPWQRQSYKHYPPVALQAGAAHPAYGHSTAAAHAALDPFWPLAPPTPAKHSQTLLFAVNHIVYQPFTRLCMSPHTASRQLRHTFVTHHATAKLVLCCAQTDKAPRLPRGNLSLPVKACEMAAGRNCLTHLDSSDLG